MADNVQASAGSADGAIFASDQRSADSVHFPLIKLAYGALDTFNVVTSTATNPLPVALSDTDNTVLDNILTAAQLIDDVVHADDAAFTLGSSKGVMMMGFAGTQSVDANDAGAIAMETDGSVHIHDGGNTITVDGTVTANLGTANVTNAGTFATQVDGAALTALQLIDDSVFADDAAFTLTSSKLTMAGVIRDDALTTLSAAEGDAVPLRVGSTGALHVTGGGGGTEYNEDDATPATIVGTATLMERDDALSTVTPAAADWIGLRGNAYGALYTTPGNVISTNNSTTSTLANDANWTSTADDVSGFNTITVFLDSTHDSATNGMTFQFTSDNADWTIADTYTFTYTAADGPRRFQFPVTAQFFRINYTNGGVTQTTFDVQTILHANNVQTSIHRVVDNVDPDRSASLTKSAIVAQAAGSGDFVPVQATAGGNFKTSISEISDGLDVGAGNAGAETARVSISTDDVNMSAIKTAVELIDNAVSGAGFNITQLAGAATPMTTTQADGLANTLDGLNTTTFNMVYNGTTWDRVREGGEAGSILVDLGANNDVTVSGSVTVDLGANNDVTIDNSSIVHAEDAAHSSGHAGVMSLAVRNDDLAALAGTDGDYAPLQVTQNGALLMCPAANDDYKYAVIDDATSGNNTLVTAVTARKIRVLAAFLISEGDVKARFESGANGTALTGQMDITTNSGFVLPFNPAGWFETASNTLLNLELDAAVSVDGSLTYIEVV